MAMVTGLSGNEIYCLALKNLTPGEIVVGNSVNSLGVVGAVGAGFRNILGGETPQITKVIHDGRAAAFARMAKEARDQGAVGITGVTSELRSFSGYAEFLFVGSALHAADSAAPLFSSAGDAQELYCHIDAGYQPLSHVFGNIAYSIGVGGGFIGGFKTLARGEIAEYSDVFNRTRHAALERIAAQAKSVGANAVVGVRTMISPWQGVHEMLMTGTGAFNPALPETAKAAPVTCDLTGEELWAMTQLGYTPVKMLISASVYSLGLIGGVMAMFKGIGRGEIPELTHLVHKAREIAVDRLKREADAVGADKVVGVKTHIAEIGNGLIEFMAVGTAMRKTTGVCVATPALPAQAIVRDKDTWIEGAFGLPLTRRPG